MYTLIVVLGITLRLMITSLGLDCFTFRTMTFADFYLKHEMQTCITSTLLDNESVSLYASSPYRCQTISNKLVAILQQRLSNEKACYLGKRMFTLGYPWSYASLRSLSRSLKPPKTGVSMFLGYLQHRGIERLDVTDYVRSLQHQIIRERVLSVL